MLLQPWLVQSTAERKTVRGSDHFLHFFLVSYTDENMGQDTNSSHLSAASWLQHFLIITFV